VQYQIAVRTRSASGNGDYEWNPRLPLSTQWWLKWAPDIVFRNPTLIRDVDTSGEMRVYLNGIVGSRRDHVNRLVKYELAIFPITSGNGTGSIATLNSEEVENLVTTWWQLRRADRLTEVGEAFDAALSAQQVSDAQIDSLDDSVNRAVVSAIRQLKRTDAAASPRVASDPRPLVVGDDGPDAAALGLISRNRSVLFSTGLNEKVFEEYEASGQLRPPSSVIIANSQEPLRLRFPTAEIAEQTAPAAAKALRSAAPAQVPQPGNARSASGGGCLVFLLLMAALLSVLTGTLW